MEKQYIQEIVSLQFKQVQDMLAENGLNVELDQTALEYLADRGYDPAFGARPIKRLLQKEIVNELAKRLIAGELESTSEIHIHFMDNKIVFDTSDVE